MWTREYIESLSENDLCRTVLVPLFKAMGYQGVSFRGGGILEQGKDLVMWRPIPPRDRLNFSVVVKATKISGSTDTITVLTQIKESFGRPFEDTATHETREVGHCIVVSSKAVPKEGTHTLGSLLREEKLQTRVTVMDGDALWDSINTYLSARLAASSLAQAYEALAPKDPGWHMEIHIRSGETTFVVTPVSGEPITVTGPAQFPETDEGRKARSAFEDFLKTGAPVELAGEYAAGFGLPPPIRELINAIGQPDLVRLGSGRPREPMHYSLEIRGEKGSFVLPHIDFSIVESGSYSVTLRNDNQPLPFRLALTLGKDRVAALSFRFELAGESVVWLQRYLEFERAATAGAVVRLKSHRTFEYHDGTLTDSIVPASLGLAYPDIVAKLVAIQERTRALVRVPGRGFPTVADAAAIDWIYEIVSTGRASSSGEITAGVHFTSQESAEVALREPVDFVVKQGSWKETLLDERLELGPVEIHANRVSIHPDDIARVESEVTAGATDIKCRWVLAADERIELSFPRFHLPDK